MGQVHAKFPHDGGSLIRYMAVQLVVHEIFPNYFQENSTGLDDRSKRALMMTMGR